MSSALKRSSLGSIFAEKGVCRLKIIYTETAFSSEGIISGPVCTGGLVSASKTTTTTTTTTTATMIIIIIVIIIIIIIIIKHLFYIVPFKVFKDTLRVEMQNNKNTKIQTEVIH